MTNMPHHIDPIKYIETDADYKDLDRFLNDEIDIYDQTSSFGRKINVSHFGFEIRKNDTIIAGLSCAHVEDWTHINALWVHQAHRKKGHGEALLAKLDHEAKKRECIGILLTTYSYQAPDFYLKNGYSILGEVKNLPKDFSRYYMIKSF